MSIQDYLIAGLISGAVGDITLQVLDHYGLGNSGLVTYFLKSDPLSSVVHASLLTGFWSGLYRSLTSLPSFQGFAIWGTGVDILYRYTYPWIYPSLRQYYTDNSFVETILFNVLVCGMVFYVVGLLK